MTYTSSLLTRQPSYLVCHHYLGLSNPCMGSLGAYQLTMILIWYHFLSLISFFFWIKWNELTKNVFSDSVPLFGYRRRSYLVLSGLLGTLSWSLMATFVATKYGVAFCIFLGSLSVAFSDVVSTIYLHYEIVYFVSSCE